MSTETCKAFLDEWLDATYDGAAEAQGQWIRTERKKELGGVVRRFQNRVWELSIDVLETRGGHLEVLDSCEAKPEQGLAADPELAPAPNGWIFGISPKGSPGDPTIIVTTHEMAFDNVGNYHSGDCDGHMPKGIYEEIESQYASDHSWDETMRLMKSHGFVHEPVLFVPYFAEWEQPAVPRPPFRR